MNNDQLTQLATIYRDIVVSGFEVFDKNNDDEDKGKLRFSLCVGLTDAIASVLENAPDSIIKEIKTLLIKRIDEKRKMFLEEKEKPNIESKVKAIIMQGELMRKNGVGIDEVKAFVRRKFDELQKDYPDMKAEII